MSAKHTRGPWAWDGPVWDYDPDNESPWLLTDEGSKSDFVLTGEMKCTEADARLIAASPELLYLAQRWVALDAGAWHPGRHEAEKRELLADTRALIAKATGGAS